MEDYQNFNRNYNDVYNMIQEHQAEDDEEYGGEAEEAKRQSSFGMCSMPKSSAKRKAGAKKSSEPEKGGIFSRLGDKISAGLFKASKTTQKSLKK